MLRKKVALWRIAKDATFLFQAILFQIVSECTEIVPSS